MLLRLSLFFLFLNLSTQTFLLPAYMEDIINDNNVASVLHVLRNRHHVVIWYQK